MILRKTSSQNMHVYKDSQLPTTGSWDIDNNYKLFLKERFNKCFRSSTPFYDAIMPETLPDPNFNKNFDYLKYNSFIQFFTNLNLNVPRIYRKSKSLRRRQNEFDLLRMNNFLMRHGLRYKSLKYLTLSLSFLKNRAKTKHFNHYNFITWQSIFLLTNYAEYNLSYNSLQSRFNTAVCYDYMLTPHGINTEPANQLRGLAFTNFHKLKSIFALYTYKVDKQIYKNTRGGSGKYTFIWKYLAPYKRASWVMNWIAKESQIQEGSNFYLRLRPVMRRVIFNHSNTWVWKLKNFSQTYVYRNCRTSLAETFRTVKN